MTEVFINPNETKYFNICGGNIAVNIINDNINVSKINDISNLPIQKITNDYLIIISNNQKNIEYHIVKNWYDNGLYVKTVENSYGCCMVIGGFSVYF